jgi:hypothetical protein
VFDIFPGSRVMVKRSCNRLQTNRGSDDPVSILDVRKGRDVVQEEIAKLLQMNHDIIREDFQR